MGEFDALAAEIYKEKIRRARLSLPEEKLRDGLHLWESVVGRMKCGVLLRHPQATDSEQVELVRLQLAKLRRLHEHNLYLPYQQTAA